MSPAFRLFAALLAALAGLAAILLILWPGWIPSLNGGHFVLPWAAGPWSVVLMDGEGRLSPPLQHGYLLAAVTLLLAVAVLTTCIDVIVPPGQSPASGPPASARKGEIDHEIAKVIALLRAHLEANGLYGTVLARANAELPSMASPEQIRLIVSYLMVENDNIRSRSRDLQANLEQSNRQIEYLKSNLAAAKVEGLSDGLTGLRNRRGFDLALAGEVTAARGNSAGLSLILADIDRFKVVNDRLGHQAGDEVLRWFSRILSANMKGRDTVARYGGDEFAIILPKTSLADAVNLAGQIRSQVETMAWQMPGNQTMTLKLTASFGAAEFRKADSTDALIRRADASLYGAKTAGRNRVAS